MMICRVCAILATTIALGAQESRAAFITQGSFPPRQPSNPRAWKPRVRSSRYEERMSVQPLPELTHHEISRYSRHLILPEVGVTGQRKLKASCVLCIGTGGLGSPLLLYLAAAGIGRIGVVDDDVVDLSNLQRQVIHGESTLGKPKVQSAKQRVLDVNPTIKVDAIQERITINNVMDLVEPYDVIVDGTDNFATRFLVNDACVMLGKPLVYGAILRFEGQASVFNYRGGPNYRDLLPGPPPAGSVPSCAEGGVFGVLPGVIGCIQATEVIKLLTGIGEPLTGRLLVYDALNMRFRELSLSKRPDAPPITSLVDYDARCADHQLADAAALSSPEKRGPTFSRLTVMEAKQRMEKGWAPFVLDVRTRQEAEIVSLPFTDALCAHRDIDDIMPQLPRDVDILVYCKGGARSTQACAELVSQGFTRITNLEGGIKAWAEQVDRRMPVY